MGPRVLQFNVRIDLLVTDVGLPGGMNGRYVVDAARMTRPGLKVLFITGYAEHAGLARVRQPRSGQIRAGQAVRDGGTRQPDHDPHLWSVAAGLVYGDDSGQILMQVQQTCLFTSCRCRPEDPRLRGTNVPGHPLQLVYLARRCSRSDGGEDLLNRDRSVLLQQVLDSAHDPIRAIWRSGTGAAEG